MSVLVLGIGNILWADEGFGVRAVEAFHCLYAMADGVDRVMGNGFQRWMRYLEYGEASAAPAS